MRTAPQRSRSPARTPSPSTSTVWYVRRKASGCPAEGLRPAAGQPMSAPMRRAAFLRVSFVLAALGVLLAVLGTAVVASRASTERAQLDRSLATAAGEKAALVD